MCSNYMYKFWKCLNTLFDGTLLNIKSLIILEHSMNMNYNLRYTLTTINVRHKTCVGLWTVFLHQSSYSIRCLRFYYNKQRYQLYEINNDPNIKF